MMAVASSGIRVSALPASHYASTSTLSTGDWVKVKVNKSGMQFVSNTQLAAMGFKDPSKVNAYGFGGQIISEFLNDSQPDDLPLLPTLHTTTGIIFFGVDHIKWEPDGVNSNFSHTMQPYAEESYYFLSDRNIESISMAETDLSNTDGLEKGNSFIERLVHEKDIFAPFNSGRNLFGEDLRGTQLQLNFDIPQNVGGKVGVTVSVGSNITNAPGTVQFSSTNSKLTRNSMTLEAIRSSEQFTRLTTSSFTADNTGNSLNLGLRFSSSGVISHARLDWVEVEYERELNLSGDQLYFYFNEPEDFAAVVKGLTAESEIWDVTSGHAPRKVKFTRKGSEGEFRVPAGYSEFIAFNPSKVNRPVEAGGRVENQDIHAMESPDMLIITPEEFMPAAVKVADMHREQDGMTVHVLTPQTIYNEFSSGTPDVSAFRKLMKMWYDRDMASGTQKLKYCLIMSRPTYDNKMQTQKVASDGYPRVPIWQSPTGFTETSSYSTDDFIGMLDDTGALFTMGNQKIRVAVGRFPVRSLEEAMTAAEKLASYTNDPGRASWRNNVMLIADDQDNGQHLEQTEKMYDGLINSNKGKDYQYERLYLDNFQQQLTSVGIEYPEAKKRLMSKFEEGQALVTYVGHANTVSWTHEHLLNWGDITSFSNTKLPILYAATCEFARWDADEYSGGEVMWAFPKTGVIAMICPSRTVFINMNGNISMQFGKNAMVRNADGTATRLGDSYMKAKNGVTGTDDNKLRYALLGDPALKMPVFAYDVVATSIYGVDVEGSLEDLPTIEARSNPVVKGFIADHDGNKMEDFNGHVYIKLYDAEKVIETLGNGNDGKVVLYNDRKTKLYDGVAKVENGEWSTTIFMPAEIENNFTPGRMTFYALSDDGREGNGSTDKFYVYGYDSNAPEDTDGPEIINFYLNHQNFKDGDVSYKTPVVYATFSDESGINLSDAGIGHKLTLTLDNHTVYTDVLNFYSPDLEDGQKGSFIYQLPEIAPGKHTLTLSVWDCANNSSYATLNFNVAAIKSPDIYDISAVAKSDRSGVDFIISSDRPLAALNCHLEVFDINGVRVWHNSAEDRTSSDSSMRMTWDYSTSAGNRVDNGIYICRATLYSPEGKTAQKSKKIVVSKQ